MAIVYCYEGVDDEPAHLVATNVFVREDEFRRGLCVLKSLDLLRQSIALVLAFLFTHAV